ncbi:hypothetical protein [Brevibacillus sp. DP1.3A]|uniref:hypothetical protein n=1 Tax=Brevibacillus sp. DP1.3A TaxID=2738867 RepID=UPI00156AFDC9|nr:hypothetical protein [Brevibacillus sp. DP1.3A]UED73244.1 hypothetical protein HP399_021230 [Brevibacillus sp. DP1.3A]
MQGIRLGDHALETLQKLNDASAKNIETYIRTAQAIPDNDYKILIQYLVGMTSFAIKELAVREQNRNSTLMQ